MRGNIGVLFIYKFDEWLSNFKHSDYYFNIIEGCKIHFDKYFSSDEKEKFSISNFLAES